MGSVGTAYSNSVPDWQSIYKDINPLYKKDVSNLDSAGYNNNCVKCAIAFEAAMRGQDVEAKPFEFGSMEDVDRSKNVNAAFGIPQGDVFTIGAPTRDRVVREIELSMQEDFGPGSRAIIQVRAPRIRHTMNVINDNGTVRIIDAQNGTQGSVSQMLKGLPTKDVIFFRTDDQQITSEYKNWAYRRRTQE